MKDSYTANELGEPKIETIKTDIMKKDTIFLILGLVVVVAGLMVEPSVLPFGHETSVNVSRWAVFIGSLVSGISAFLIGKRKFF